MMVHPIPDGVRRFLLTSIPTVPHLETLLLLWREPGAGWTAEDIARRLYVPVAAAQSLAEDLCEADLLECDGTPRTYRCRREVTALIHSHVDRKASRFADAFSLRKEKD